MMRAPAADGYHVEQFLRLDAGGHAKSEGFGCHQDVSHGHHVVDQLDHFGRADAARMLPGLAQQVEQRFGPFQGWRFAAHQKHQLAGAGLVRTAANRAIQYGQAFGRGGRAYLFHAVWINGAQFDQHAARFRQGDDAAIPQPGAFHGVWIWQRCENGRSVRQGGGQAICHVDALCLQGLARGFVDVIAHDVVLGLA